MDRNQKKWAKKVNTSISPDRPPAEFVVVGKTKQGMTQNAKIGLGAVAAIMVAAFAAGYYVVPGFFFFIWLFREMNPPRLVTVSRHEICSYSQSSFNNNPKELMGAMPLVPLQPSVDGAVLTIGTEAIAFKAKQYRQLLEATHELTEANRVESRNSRMHAPLTYAPPMAAAAPQIFS